MPHPRVEVHPSRGPHNSLLYAFRDVSRWRVAWNVVCLRLAGPCPWFRLKAWLVRRAGVRVGSHVAIGLGAQFDVLFPGRITLGDGCIVGYGATLLAHAYTGPSYQLGDVRVGRGATVGANATVLPGVTIGDGAVVGAMSLVSRDVPPNEFWAGVPARLVRRLDTPPGPAPAAPVRAARRAR